MGIKSLFQIIKKHSSEPFEEIPMERFRGKRFAIDISIFICRYVLFSQEFWLNLMTNFLLSFKKWGIDILVIFDGKHQPELKSIEHESRKSSQQKSKSRLDNLALFRDKLLITCYDEENVTTKLVPEDLQDELKKLCRFGKNDNINTRDPDDVLVFITEKIGKTSQAAEGVSKLQKEMTRSLIKAMGIPFLEAYGEAEGLAASFAYHGLCDGVIGGDSDTLVYGCEIFIRGIEKGIADVVFLSKILKSLDLSMSQFRDVCICLGCDYNTNMKKIDKSDNSKGTPAQGPAKVLPAIKKYGSIENWQKNHSELPFYMLKWKACREIFRPFSKSYLDKCKIATYDIDVDKLNELFESVSSQYTGEYVLGCLQGKTVPVFLKKDSNILGDME